MKDLFVAHVPQIEGLTVMEILKEAKKHVDIELYLPNLSKGKQPDRNFVWNVGKWFQQSMSVIVNTLIPKKLSDLIEKWMATREIKFIKKRNLNMKVLPEFSELFNNAPWLSSESFFLYFYKEQKENFII